MLWRGFANYNIDLRSYGQLLSLFLSTTNLGNTTSMKFQFPKINYLYYTYV